MSHSDPSTTQSLVCMEIWGGNQATNRTVKTPGLDLWVYSRPHEDVEGGGDVHYVSLCGGGRITRFVLADVSGHGTTVAELAKSLRLLMRKNINRKDQTRFVQSLNREFSELSKLNRFATAVVATYLTGGDTLTVCNAGHPRPLYYRAGTSSWAVLRHDETLADGPADLPLGILEETGYTQVQLHLGPGDLVLFYTDALTEAEAPDGQRLNEEGLIGILQKLDGTKPSEIPSALIAALDQFRGGQPADDDMTFLLLHHNAGPAQPPGILESFRVFAQVLGLKSV
ncbi:MAG: PP2C family protein-serine/threonine phosphatase [Gemmataceae bacterium]